MDTAPIFQRLSNIYTIDQLIADFTTGSKVLGKAEGVSPVFENFPKLIADQFYNHYEDRFIGYENVDRFKRKLSEYFATLFPSLMIKLAGLDEQTGNNLQQQALRAVQNNTTTTGNYNNQHGAGDIVSPASDNTLTTSPKTGDEFAHKDFDIGQGNSNSTRDRATMDYVKDLIKVQDSRLAIPVLSFIGEFNNLFVQIGSWGVNKPRGWGGDLG